MGKLLDFPRNEDWRAREREGERVRERERERQGKRAIDTYIQSSFLGIYMYISHLEKKSASWQLVADVRAQKTTQNFQNWLIIKGNQTMQKSAPKF